MRQERLVPLREYARRTGIPETTLRLYVREGRLHAVRLGRYWYIPVEGEGAREGLGRVFTLFTHAGGAGKTSLARDLGFELASRGYRVLLIDADPQANLTAWLGLDPSEVLDGETLLSVVEGRGLPGPKEAPLEGVRLDLIPANMNLAMAEVVIPTKTLGMVLLRTALMESGVLEAYDFILIDSPPSLGPIAGMAALAGEGLVVPVETSAKGVQALKAVLEVSRDYQKTLRSLRFLPADAPPFVRLLVPTKFDPRTLQDKRARALLEEIAEMATVSPALGYRPAPYKEAIDRGLPVQVVGDERLREEYRALGDAFLRMVGVDEGKPEEVS
ncbi:MAG: AAA family ATPase [Thermus sp.]|uniref:AAA family ATPase n=1 Tax=Thermus sp. TaxID=275 RepID=UPI0025F3F0BA|nr:AAA family ATPase [Thermus sp.]MCS6868273.1 AAA family ATPase [Thermus sp.]MCS7219579.1 AAA family ATPase [Thermus sp.]MDW8358208.1 AAA family ATPase [Thermus sp.]